MLFRDLLRKTAGERLLLAGRALARGERKYVKISDRYIGP